MNNTFEAVVFDLDGVLIESEPIHMRAWRDAVEERNGDLPDDLLRLGVGMTDVTYWPLVAPKIGMDPLDESMIALKRERYLALLERDGLPAAPGALALVRRLSGKLPMGIATSSRREALSHAMKVHGWEDTFQITLAREDVMRHKPAPEIYQKAASLLGAAPDRCAAIEDSPPGLRSAIDAGFGTVAVTANFPREALREANLVVGSLEEMEGIVEFLGLDGA